QHFVRAHLAADDGNQVCKGAAGIDAHDRRCLPHSRAPSHRDATTTACSERLPSLSRMGKRARTQCKQQSRHVVLRRFPRLAAADHAAAASVLAVLVLLSDGPFLSALLSADASDLPSDLLSDEVLSEYPSSSRLYARNP